MKTKLSVVKIGGNIIDDEVELVSFLKYFVQRESPKILIHGGGKIATELNKKMGIKTEMNEGRRITSSNNLEVVTMVYAGLINKNIVAKLQGNGSNAIGLSGADANCILASKRPTKPVDFGWVGDVERVNADVIDTFLSNGITPIFSAICHDGNGQLLNTNADTIASEIAIAMTDKYETELIYCFEKQGVLFDINDDDSVIENIDSVYYQELKSNNVIHDGMLPKIENCFHALNNKVSNVIIGGTKSISKMNGLFTHLTL